MFGKAIQDWVRALALRLMGPLVQAPITPNQITVVGLVFCLLVAGLTAMGALLAAGLVLALSSVTDIADGALARARGTCSDYGAFFDSLLDRIGEAVIGLGIMGSAIADELARIGKHVLAIERWWPAHERSFP